MASRRIEREYAIKVAFAHHFNTESVADICTNLKGTDEHAEEALTEFSVRLATLAVAQYEEIDELIVSRLKDWELKRIPKIDHVILRVAIAELIYFKDVPASIIINEFLELTKMFSSEKSRKFINGVLDSVAKEVRA
jgi:N utilization substance protein B